MFKIKSVIICLLCVGVASQAADSLVATNDYRSLFSDQKARHVGDLLSVIVLEATTAESSAGTGESSEFSVEGRMFDLANDHRAGAGLAGSAEGEGQTRRRGIVKSQISVRVTEVISPDIVRIQGQQSLTINGETQKVIITGLVRTQDISRDNAVLSNRIAEAGIEIAGNGDVSDAQQRSIIYKVLKWLHLV